MKSEMDVMGLDERQRLCWLYANRFLIFLVGIVWIGMIAYDLLHGGMPLFMIAMVPVFALVRWLVYLYYSRRAGKVSSEQN